MARVFPALLTGQRWLKSEDSGPGSLDPHKPVGLSAAGCLDVC